jgi:zinc transport system substrate-binding protein
MDRMNKSTPRLKQKIPNFFVFVFLILCIVGMGYAENRNPPKIKVITSVFPLMEFAQAVCGERGKVSLLLPPGAEIHTWRPRPSDMIKIAKSDVLIHIGAGLEPWLEDVLESVNNPRLHIFKAMDSVLPTESVEYKEHIPHEHQHIEGADGHRHDTIDPHIWLDFVIDQRIIDALVELFSQIEPGNSALFQRNGIAYKQKLQECDRRYREELARCKSRTFILGGHAAFGYMAQRYGLRQLSLYGVSPDSRPTPRQLVRIVDLAKEHDIDMIYFEVYVSDDLAKVIAEEVGAKTCVLNPASNLTPEQSKENLTFLEIMDHNLESLKKGLSCD